MGRFTAALQVALLVSAVLFLSMYVWIALQRIRYPFELEWMEGGAVDHVRRILHGEPLYVAPSMRFVPYIYPPLYFYVSAVVAGLMGIGFVPLRLVSFVASIGCFVIMATVIHRETRGRIAAIIGTGLFAATFRIAGGWFDLARVDSLFLLFVLSAALLFRFGRPHRAWIAGAILLLLAFLTKQAALLIALPILMYAVLVDWRAGGAVAIGFALVTAATIWSLDRLHDGWFVYYVFHLPSRVQAVEPIAWPFWTTDMFRALPVTSSVAAISLALMARRFMDRKFWFYALTAAGMVGSSWASRLHAGAFDNVLMPAYAASAILVGLMFGEVAATGRRKVLHTLLCAACLLQFVLLRYDARALLPTAADLEAGQQLIDVMSSARGDVFVPWHGHLPALAHKPTYAHGMAVYDIGRAGESNLRDRLRGEITGAIRDGRFEMLILDRVEPWLRRDLEEAYYLDRRLFDDRDVFWPVTGLRTRPELLYRRRR